MSAGAARIGRFIRVRGLVQGVGFRPHVWRLARDCRLQGEVRNDGAGVEIRVWGAEGEIADFLHRLGHEAPPLARIEGIESSPLDEAPRGSGFHILASEPGRVRTGIVPDAAICPACATEIRDPGNRRYRYPFTNCTHCGPRLSIIRAIPYDRANTTMAVFPMCARCRAEYEDPSDRRFHAQPNACSDCGPRVWLEDGDGQPLDWRRWSALDAIAAAAELLRQGRILAIKGLGGFHLACDATRAETVARLRQRKRRYHKPFALMARDPGVIRRYGHLAPEAEARLKASSAPILILEADGPERLPKAVAPGQDSLGFMLPYTPLHLLLLDEFDRPLVLTSGNRSDEPQCLDNAEARERLAGIADFFLMHDRDILNRLDDSVLRPTGAGTQVVRRARGLAPAPLPLPPGFASAPPILALGGELKNSFCLLKDGQAILSQHIGDLEDPATFADFRRSLGLFQRLFEFAPERLVVDLHPGYRSHRFGRDWAQRDGLELVAVPHHHAHIAACLAEHGWPLDQTPVLGIAFDGLGYGPDGSLWGGEFLLADYLNARRLGRLRPLALLGGERAMREPWRNTYSHLMSCLGWKGLEQDFATLPLIAWLRNQPRQLLDPMLQRGLNSPPTSSAGRWFDAVAAALGLCREEASYEGQAAIELEVLARQAAEEAPIGYPFERRREEDSGLWQLDPGPMWLALLEDLAAGVAPSRIARRFHLGLADACRRLIEVLWCEQGQPTIALSGGVFQNRLFLETLVQALRELGAEVLDHTRVPTNDGGLALGQAVVAAARRLRPGRDTGGV